MRTRKRYLSLAAVFCLLSSLAACTGSEDGEGGNEAVGPVGPVPEGLEKFYGQQLDWGECEPYATDAMAKQTFAGEGLECARLTVPLAYDEPRGDSITVGVLRKPAGEADRRIGSLVLNPGGPGGSGMTTAAQLAGTTADTELGKRFDLVGFDPRGIGASEPSIECLTDAETDAERADTSDLDGVDDVADAEREAKDFAKRCTERTAHGEEMLANLGTRDVVRDIDVLRSVLGDEKLTYLGYSYGTRIGYSYAEQFPGNVRALLLDGAVDPEQDMLDSLVGQAEGFGNTFGKFTEWCAAKDDCALGRNPAEAVAAYQDLVRPLLDEPLSLSDGRTLSYDDATTGTIAALYSEQLWSTLNEALNGLRQGNGVTLMALADTYHERGPDGKYSSTQEGLVAIRCVDDPPVTDKAAIEQAQGEYYEKAEFLDPGLPPSAARDACAFWPVEHTSEPHLPDVEGVPPTLVVSTTDDPATPYQAGVNLAKAMNGRLLSFEGAQHTAFLTVGNQCVDQAGTAYLVDRKLPPEGTRCGP